MRRKKFEMGVGKYYFNVLSGPQTVTIHRIEKAAAVNMFHTYKKLGKNCEWLGKWNGKKFDDNESPAQ